MIFCKRGRFGALFIDDFAARALGVRGYFYYLDFCAITAMT